MSSLFAAVEMAPRDPILGLNEPKSGRVRLFGHEAMEFPPHMRARLGVARTFQVLQLFNELSVFDNQNSHGVLGEGHRRDYTFSSVSNIQDSL